LSKQGVAKPSQIGDRGIPRLDLAEKIDSVVPVKLQASVKRAVPKPRSTWIRQTIIEKLKRVEEEKDFE
jgi:hypothetical protein